MSASLTVEGNITKEPRMFSTGEYSACNFTVAYNQRRKDAQGNWVDGETMFIECTIGGSYAQQLTSQPMRGRMVIVHGLLEQSSWTDRQGQKRLQLRLRADMVGLSLRFAPRGSALHQQARQRQQAQPYQPPREVPSVEQVTRQAEQFLSGNKNADPWADGNAEGYDVTKQF